MQDGFVKYINEDKVQYCFYKKGNRQKSYENNIDFLNDFTKFDIRNKYRKFFDMDNIKVENFLIDNDV